MKAAAFWVSSLLVFSVFNSVVAYKEAAIRNGTTMLLRLAPVDPRSLMQGDYMALRYQLAEDAVGQTIDHHGQLVVRLDPQHVAHFVRIHRGQPLADDEHLLRYTRTGGRLRVGTDAFFFQEGSAAQYANAQYGEMKVAPSGESILVGLRAADLTPCAP